eukprot:8882620-Pyramimonas_sp.AAC.1
MHTPTFKGRWHLSCFFSQGSQKLHSLGMDENWTARESSTLSSNPTDLYIAHAGPGQSSEGRGNIPIVRSNRVREEGTK